jgi:PBP1b-binding outer membrane lipoprotein LpoB
MRISNVLMTLAATAFLITGCSNQKTPATSAVEQAEAAMTQVRPDAEKYAPEELKTTDASLAKLKSDLAAGDYKGVVAGVPEFNKDIAALKDAVVAKQTQAAAATNEWNTLSAEVPKTVEAIQARVDALSKAKLPKEVNKEAFDAAKASLETMKATWAEATAAFTAGNAAEATDKGRMVQAKAEEVKGQLAMSPPA